MLISLPAAVDVPAAFKSFLSGRENVEIQALQYASASSLIKISACMSPQRSLKLEKRPSKHPLVWTKRYRQVYFAGWQVAGCRLKFNFNWKTAGTKNN